MDQPRRCRCPDKPYDYLPALVAATRHAADTANTFQRAAATAAANAVASLTGPVGARQAYWIVAAQPPVFQWSLPPLQVTVPQTGPDTPGPTAPRALLAAQSQAPGVPPLGIQAQQGTRSWYWVLVQPDVSVVSGTSGVSQQPCGLVLLVQVTITPTVSVWALYGCGQGTGDWVTAPPVYLSADQVTAGWNPGVGSWVTWASPQAAGSIAIADDGMGFTVDARWAVAPLSVSAVATSALGPVFEQGTGNLETVGPFQNGYWSIVDGALSAGEVSGAGATAGTAWLDYEQFGWNIGRSGALQWLAALTPAPTGSLTPDWMFCTLQEGGPSGLCASFVFPIVGTSAQNALQSGELTHGTALGVWWPCAGPGATRYNLPATAAVTQEFSSSLRVPTQVTLTIPGIGSWQLTGYARGDTPALLVPGLSGKGYETPCTITGLPQGRGVIEWNISAMDRATAAQYAGLPPTFVADTAGPDGAAIAVLVAGIVAFCAVVVGITLGALAAGKKLPGQSQSALGRRPSP